MLRKKIFLNTIVNSGGKLLSFALQIFIITYLIKTLGKEAYGVVVLALALVANTNILEAGFGLSVTKYVAEYHAKGSREKILHIINTNLVISTVLGIVMCAVLTLINELFLEKIFTIPAELVHDTKVMIRALIALSIFEFWSVSLIRVAEGFQQYALARGMEFTKWLLRAVFVFIAVYAGYGLPGIGMAYLFAGLMNLGIVYFKVVMQDPNIRVAPALCTKEAYKELFGFSVWILFSKAFAFLSYRIDTIVIGIFLPPANLAYYSIAFKIYEVLSYGIPLISSTLVPVASNLEAQTKGSQLSSLFNKSSKYTVLLIYPLLVFTLFYAHQIIPLWVGEGFEPSVSLSQILIVSLFFMSLITSGAVIMVGLNRAKELVPFAGLGAFVNVIVSIYLVKKIGVNGVAIGTLVGTCIITLGYLYRMRQFFSYFLGHVIIQTTVKQLISIFLFSYLLSIQQSNIYVGMAITLFYLLGSIILFADKDDKDAFIHYFSR